MSMIEGDTFGEWLTNMETNQAERTNRLRRELGIDPPEPEMVIDRNGDVVPAHPDTWIAHQDRMHGFTERVTERAADREAPMVTRTLIDGDGAVRQWEVTEPERVTDEVSLLNDEFRPLDETDDEYLDRLGVTDEIENHDFIVDAEQNEIRTVNGQEFRVIIDEVVNPETFQTEQRERLVPIFDLEDEGEDDTTFDNLLHPNTDALENGVGLNMNDVRAGRGHTIHQNTDGDIGFPRDVNFDGEITIRNTTGNNARITATELEHPVTMMLNHDVELLQENHRRMHDMVTQQQDRIEHLERQIDRIANANLQMVELIQQRR